MFAFDSCNAGPSPNVRAARPAKATVAMTTRQSGTTSSLIPNSASGAIAVCQQRRHDRAKRQAGGTTGRRQHERLDQQLPDDGPPRPANGEADGGFPPPGAAAGPEHVREVEARDEEHDAGHRHEEEDRPPRLRRRPSVPRSC